MSDSSPVPLGRVCSDRAAVHAGWIGRRGVRDPAAQFVRSKGVAAKVSSTGLGLLPMRSPPILFAALLASTSLSAPPENVPASTTPSPGSISGVIAINDAARARHAAAAAPVIELARELLGIERLPAAWSGLAQQLALEPEQAFDELLGRRSVLVLGQRGAEGPLPWTLLSEVSADSARRLREKLNPAPRAMADGLPVLSLEHGAYELTMRPSSGEPQGSGWSTAVLSPTGNPALPMPASLSALAFPVRGLGDEPGKRSDLLAYSRDKDTGFWAIDANFVPQGLVGRVAASPALFGLTDHDPAFGRSAVPPLSPAPAEGVILDIEGVVTELPASPTAMFAKQAAGIFGKLGVKGPDDSLFGRRLSIRLETTTVDAVRRRTFLLAVEVSDVTKAAAECDRFMTELLHAAPGGENPDSKALLNLHGSDPFACRVATLKGAAGQPSTVAWMVVKSPAKTEKDTAPDSAGYWCMSFATGAPDVEAEFRALVGRLDGQRDAWPRPVLHLNVRPGLLFGPERSGDTRSSLVNAWRGVELARLELWRTASERIDGHVVLQMASPKATPAQPALATPTAPPASR